MQQGGLLRTLSMSGQFSSLNFSGVGWGGTECREGKFNDIQKLQELSRSLLWKVLVDLPPKSQEKQGASENKGAIVDSLDGQATNTTEIEGHTIVPSSSPFSRLVGKIKGRRLGDGDSV